MRILVIAPHADDEVLGCGGYLLHHKKLGSEILIVIGTIGGVDKRQVFSERNKEFQDVCSELGAKGMFLFKDKDAMLDTIPSFELTTKFDNVIDSFHPDEIFVNMPSRHQDHVKVYNCAMASLRMREGYVPKFVALYEYPFSLQDGSSSHGKAFHDISNVVDEKVKLFSLYKSQVKSSPSPLNGCGIRALAKARGLEAGVEYAEMFYIKEMLL